MEIEPVSLPHELRAKLLLGLVVPRPIAVVSTVSTTGHFNIAPFSYYNVVSDEPMMLAFSITGPKPDGTEKDTLHNVRPIEEGGVGEFVINVATRNYAREIARAGKSLPIECSEFDFAPLTPMPSRTVKAPRIKEARASFECRTWRIIELGQAHLVIGEVTHVAVQDHLLDGRMRIDIGQMQPLARLAGNQFCLVVNPFEITVEHAPSWLKEE
jgi:flavin reductase (DIM6/NTAB) family NADH-FMN oxidoreductase RutF